jgi:peptidoglycan hydrolase CwlO-like protein
VSAQLIAKVSNLDGTVQEQMNLNQTLQQEVARANEMNDKISEQEGKVRRLEAENTEYQEKIKKLQQVLMPDSHITLLSSTDH